MTARSGRGKAPYTTQADTPLHASRADTDREQQIDPRWREVRHVLAVRLDNLGDVLVTTPALHAIKESLPQARLTLLASPVGAQVARLNPDVDDVLVYEAPWMDPWHQLPQDSAREQRMIDAIRARRFDGAIIFTSFRQSPLPAAYLCYLADIPLRVAASIDGPGSLLTTRHKHPERMMHEVERGLDLVGAIGLGTEERDLVLRVPQAAREELANLPSYPLPSEGRSTGPFVVVHPGCSMPARTYPEEMYSQVIERLVRRLGARVAVTGAGDERELVARVVGRLGDEVRAMVVPLAGELSFPAFCALIESADLTITNNTGPMHVAAALQTPVITLFALTNPPEQWGPWHVPHRQLYAEVPCRICYNRICPHGHECLRLVTPEMVVAAAADLLAEVEGKVGSQRAFAELPYDVWQAAGRQGEPGGQPEQAREVGLAPTTHQTESGVGATPVSPGVGEGHARPLLSLETGRPQAAPNRPPEGAGVTRTSRTGSAARTQAATRKISARKRRAR